MYLRQQGKGMCVIERTEIILEDHCIQVLIDDRRLTKMTTYKLEDSELEGLKGKTILITGCATGIGRATVLIAHSRLFCTFGWARLSQKLQDTVQTLRLQTGMKKPRLL